MIGQTVSHYKILEELGRGGMGVVYKARDTRLDRDVALKFLPQHLASSEAERARLFQEAKAAAALNHPSIAHIYAIEEVDERAFIVMEYVDGTELKETITGRPLPVDKAITIALEISRGLQKAHDHGIVHRDIKSSNIMLTHEGHVKIMDFGLAKVKGGAQLTKAGSTVGTAAYMSPEQARGDEVDHRTDIWSLGVVLYEMLAGRLPFASDYDQAAIYSILNESPAPLSTVNPEVPQRCADVVMRALEKDPARRYASATEMATALRSASDGSEGSTAGRAPRGTNSKGTRWMAVGIPAFLLAVVVGFFLLRGKSESIDSLAVLPFENAGGDESMEYLSDGITESLINSLSRLPYLKVMSRSSVFRFKGNLADPQSVGEKLGVRAVLAGRVMQRGDNLLISAELIDASNNTHLWGEQYDRKSEDILAIQGEIAREISQGLRLQLAEMDVERLAKPATGNSEAYQLYLKGRFYWNKRTVGDLHRSAEYFEQAAEVDPTYSLAYAGLADSYLLLGVYNDVAPLEVFPRAKAAAGKALEIDPALAEVHATLGDINIHFAWDWEAAGNELRRSIELDPGYATAHHWYAEYLTIMGRHDEAIPASKKARELDPLSPVISSYVGWNYYMAGNYDSAMVECQKTVRAFPDFPWGRFYLAMCYEKLGMHDEMVAELETARDLYDHQLILARLAYGYALSGRRDEALEVRRTLTLLSKRRFVTAYAFALIELGLGHRNEALGWLEKSCEERSPTLSAIVVDPTWDPLRPEPRFVAILKKMGLS